MGTEGLRCFYDEKSVKSDLDEIAASVVDEASFLRFLKALEDDWNGERAKEKLQPSSPYGPGAEGWENITIGAFLEAAVAWANARPAGADGNVWRRIADILLAGKFYE